MKALVVGYGSIGKRHCEVLENLDFISSVSLVTSQEVRDKICYKNLQSVPNLSQFSYFIIATPTFLHLENLKFLDERVKGKIIFCEKPLFETAHKFTPQNNKIFVGYVLRFHPLLQKLKELLANEKILFINASCGQYLPTWRNDDYKLSYSADKLKGGGVLLDLSHEIDYTTWLGGKLNRIKSFKGKISDLEITSDDLCVILGKNQSGAIVNISIDYISKISRRELLVECENSTFRLDFIANKLVKKDKFDSEEIFQTPNLQRNELFVKMHEDIFKEQKFICKFNEGLETMETIFKIQRQNNE